MNRMAAAASVIAIAGLFAAPPLANADASWDCRVDGNMICGPANSQGVTPGYYGDPSGFQPWDRSLHWGKMRQSDGSLVSVEQWRAEHGMPVWINPNQ